MRVFESDQIWKDIEVRGQRISQIQNPGRLRRLSEIAIRFTNRNLRIDTNENVVRKSHHIGISSLIPEWPQIDIAEPNKRLNTNLMILPRNTVLTNWLIGIPFFTRWIIGLACKKDSRYHLPETYAALLLFPKNHPTWAPSPYAKPKIAVCQTASRITKVMSPRDGTQPNDKP